MSESALVSKQLEEKLKIVLKQKQENDKLWLQLRRGLPNTCKEVINGRKKCFQPSEQEIQEFKQKESELRFEAEIITLEIQILKKKIAEARIEEL